MNQPKETKRYAKRTAEKRQTFSVTLPPRLIKAVRKLADRRGESLGLIVEELLDEAIYGNSPAKSA